MSPIIVLTGYGMNTSNSRIDFIQNLRGVAVLLVVLYHLVDPLMNAYQWNPILGRDLFRNGNAGVDLFFMISGFVICYATSRKEEFYRVSFIIRRIFRIYPVFVFCLTMAWLTYDSFYPVGAFFRAVFLIHSNYSTEAPFFGFNLLYPAWTISYEILFYGIFFVAMSINHEKRVLFCSVFIISLMLIIQLIAKEGMSIFGHFSVYDNTFGFISPFLCMLGSPMMLEFIIGMICYEFYKSTISIKKNFVLYLMITIFAVACVSFIKVDTRFHGITDKGLMALAFFLPLLVMEKQGIRIKSRVISFLADISYSLYLSHVIFLRLYRDYLKVNGQGEFSKGLLSLITLIVICIAIAWLIHVFLEKPFINAGKVFIRKMQSQKT